MNYAPRIRAVQSFLRQHNYDACVISGEANVRYLSGFTGSECPLIVTPAQTFLLADFRYTLQAMRESGACFEVLQVKEGFAAMLLQLAVKLHLRTVCFEERYMTVAVLQRLQRALKRKIRLVPWGGVIERLRQIKSDEEIACLRRAAGITREALKRIHPLIKPGISELTIKRRLEHIINERGTEGPAFDIIVASGPHAAMPHAKTTERRIQPHEPVIIDCGASWNGYKSDLTRTFFSGNMSQYAHYYRLVAFAQQTAVSMVRPGCVIGELDRACRRIFEDAHVGDYFGHALGHGLGLEIHESPTIRNPNQEKLQSGMIITVEPGLYMPEWGGIRLEDMVLVTHRGYEVL